MTKKIQDIKPLDGRTKTTFEDKVKMTIMARQGKTYQRIADHFGVSRARVHQIVKGYVPPSHNKRSFTDKLLDKFRS